MIKVKAVIPDGKFESLRVKGHADFAPHGQDLVCAGVSAIVIGGINSLKYPESFDIFQESGLVVIKLKPKENITNYDAVVINTMLIQLETIEQSYGKYITVNYHSRKETK
jgi:hypothetical protein